MITKRGIVMNDEQQTLDYVDKIAEVLTNYILDIISLEELKDTFLGKNTNYKIYLLQALDLTDLTFNNRIFSFKEAIDTMFETKSINFTDKEKLNAALEKFKDCGFMVAQLPYYSSMLQLSEPDAQISIMVKDMNNVYDTDTTKGAFFAENKVVSATRSDLEYIVLALSMLSLSSRLAFTTFMKAFKEATNKQEICEAFSIILGESTKDLLKFTEDKNE